MEQKWNAFARRYHILFEVLPFAAFVCLLTTATLYRVASVWEIHVSPYYNQDEENAGLHVYAQARRCQRECVQMHCTPHFVARTHIDLPAQYWAQT